MGSLKDAFSTRRVVQHTSSSKMIHEVNDDELKELQALFLDMLKDFIAVCEKYDICYMAAGGTALGAIRHQGFIPWDDDVDVIMPRDDLEKFKTVFGKEMGDKYEMTSPNSEYQLESMISAIYRKNTLKASFLTYNAPFPKGVHIDIFAIESVPVNPIVRDVKGITSMMLQYIGVSSILYHYRNDVKKRFFYQTSSGKFNYRLRCSVGSLFSFKPYYVWGNLFDRYVRGKKDTGLWAVPTDVGHYFGHIMPKDVYYPPVKKQFEDILINVPHNWDEYLKNQYGDYMTIPPIEGRETHYAVGFSLDLEHDDEARRQMYDMVHVDNYEG